MNSIENDFFETLTAGNLIDYDIAEQLATELSGKVERFIKWLLSVREMQTRMSIPELYNWWLTNVDNK